MYFRVYQKPNSLGSPLTDVKYINDVYTFDLSYTNNGKDYIGDVYLRGYAGSKNQGVVSAEGSWGA